MGCHAEGLEKLKYQVHENLTRFDKTSFKVLPLGWGKPRYQHRLWDEQTESNLGENDLGVLVGERLDMTQSCDIYLNLNKLVQMV